MNWDTKFLLATKLIASWSKHPNIKVGCVVVDDDHNQLSGGYNGLPRKANDALILNQTKKVSITVHAEANAVAAAARNGHSLKGGTCYVNRPVCAQCAALLVQAGIRRVIAIAGEAMQAFDGELNWLSFDGDHGHILRRTTGDWADSCLAAWDLFRQTGVNYALVQLHPELKLLL
jgi:dCMP deaminase